MAIVLGDLNDRMEIEIFFFDLIRVALENRVRDVGAGIELAPFYGDVEFRSRKSGDETRLFETKNP